MRGAASKALKSLVVLALVGYQLVVHFAVSDMQSGANLRLALVLLPLLALVFWVVARATSKALWLAVLLLVGGVAYLLEHRESMGLVAFNGLSHTAAYLFLLWYFGRTLTGGGEPLITKFARRVHGTLTPVMEGYTRRLTVAWCVFFAGQLAVSALLYLLAPLDAWSIFVNLLNLPLVFLMFVIEGAYRGIRHPGHPRVSIEQAIRVFMSDSALPKGTGAR
jgi:uncharacterized membrane protein